MARSDLRRVVGVRAKLTGVLFALLASSPALAASVSEQWKAVSTAAISITGRYYDFSRSDYLRQRRISVAQSGGQSA
jgi:hypothetical protein